MTLERLNELLGEAYKHAGYSFVRFSDGSQGVLRLQPKTSECMNLFYALVANELGLGKFVAPSRCAVCKKPKDDDGVAVCARKRCQPRPALAAATKRKAGRP